MAEPIAQQFARPQVSPVDGEPMAQHFTRQPASPVPNERLVIPPQVLPCTSDCFATQKLVATRSQTNLKMPLGKTFIVPRGAFGPQRAKEDGGTLFEMIQRRQNGFISQKEVKKLMAQAEATTPCTPGQHVMPGLPNGDVQSIASPRQSIASPRLVTRDVQNMATSLLDTSNRTISTMCPTPLGSVRIPIRRAGSFFGSPVSAILSRPVSMDSSFDALSMVGNPTFASRPVDSSSMVRRQMSCQSAGNQNSSGGVSAAGVSTATALAAGGVSCAGVHTSSAPVVGGSISMTRQEDVVVARRFDRTEMQARGRLTQMRPDKVDAQVAAQTVPGIHGQTMDAPPLKLTIVSAKGLREADWLPGAGKHDPYCECEIAGKPREGKVQTKVINNTLDPVWEHHAELPGFSPGDTLVFKIYDKDLAKSDYLGELHLASDKFYPHGFQGELPLANAGEGISAYLKLNIQPAKANDRINEHSWEDEFLQRAKWDTTVVVHAPVTVSAHEFAQSSGQIVSSALPVTAGHTLNKGAGRHG